MSKSSGTKFIMPVSILIVNPRLFMLYTIDIENGIVI